MPKRTASQQNPWPILAVIMLVLGACFGGLGVVGLRYMQNQSAEPVQQDAEAATSIRSARTKTRQPVTTAVGRVVRDGDFAFKVTRIRMGAGQTMVYLVVKNISMKPQALAPSVQQLRGAGDLGYPVDATASSVRSKRLWNRLPAGKAVTGIMVFPAGSSAKATAVELHGSIGSTGILVQR